MKFDTSSSEIKIFDFNALQAYKIGRRLEVEGIEFYKGLLLHEKAADNFVKEGIKFIMHEEERHLRLMEAKIEEITEQEYDGFEEEDIGDFINTSVFAGHDSLRHEDRNFNSLPEVIEFGKMIEQRSVMFYTAILEHIEDESGRMAVNSLISEERDHLIKLDAVFPDV